jgi:hypothetical protein
MGRRESEKTRMNCEKIGGLKGKKRTMKGIRREKRRKRIGMGHLIFFFSKKSSFVFSIFFYFIFYLFLNVR